MCNCLLDTIKDQLREIHSTVERLSDDDILSGPPNAVCEAHDRLDRLATMDVEDHFAERLRHDPTLSRVLESIVRLRRLFGLRLELEYARSVLASPEPRSKLRAFPFHANYEQLVRTEYEGAGLKASDTVAFLGSGPLPMTLITLCEQYDVQGVGCEQVPEYCDLSERVVRCLGLSERIDIRLGNHFSFPLKQNCRLVMVAAAARPKEEIFNHFAKVLPEGTRVSYRINEKGLRRLLDDQPPFAVPAEFREHRRCRPQPPVSNTVVFLTKGDPSAPSSPRQRNDG